MQHRPASGASAAWLTPPRRGLAHGGQPELHTGRKAQKRTARSITAVTATVLMIIWIGKHLVVPILVPILTWMQMQGLAASHGYLRRKLPFVLVNLRSPYVPLQRAHDCITTHDYSMHNPSARTQHAWHA